ncbi:MAG: DUF4364 family protein [Clostridia bacterium]
MEMTTSTTVSKLVLLYVFDKMEMPLTENTIIDMCCSRNTWITYMNCKEVLSDLIEIGFIVKSNKNGDEYYTLTTDGRSCLSYFFMKIPSSLRDEIALYIKNNRINLKRKQEYFRNYYKNADGSYTVVMRIVEPLGTKLELKLNVANRYNAKLIYNKWEEKAGQVYGALYDILIE